VVFNLFRKNDAPQEAPKTEDAIKTSSDLLRFILSHLVDYPEEIEIQEVQSGKVTVLEMKVNEADMGKVIGKKGRIIKSIRSVLRAAAAREGRTVSVELRS